VGDDVLENVEKLKFDGSFDARSAVNPQNSIGTVKQKFGPIFIRLDGCHKRVGLLVKALCCYDLELVSIHLYSVVCNDFLNFRAMSPLLKDVELSITIRNHQEVSVIAFGRSFWKQVDHELFHKLNRVSPPSSVWQLLHWL